MSKQKKLFRISKLCTETGHSFREILNFWVEKGQYEMVSNSQSPTGHPL